MEGLHVLLIPNEEHKKVFPDVPLYLYLVGAELSKLEESGRCELSEKKLAWSVIL